MEKRNKVRDFEAEWVLIFGGGGWVSVCFVLMRVFK